jgi:hypothetical protein
LEYVNGQKASGSVNGFLSSVDWNAFNNKVGTARSINTTAPLSGGGDLSADRTLSIANAAADGATKGAASFTGADFDASSGNISLDYVNGQKASGSVNGFLSSADYTTFNGKQAAGNYITALTSDVTASGPGSAAATIANNAVTFPKIVNATATQRAMGRNTAGSGNWEEVTATQMLDWIGSTRGSVLYRGSGGWTILTPGASGTLLQSQGAGADPFWSSHLVGTGTAPTAVTNVAAGGGSVLTLDASAHDTACRITIITGAAPTTGLIFRLTYGTAYPSVPHVVWSATSIASGQLITRTYVSNITASAFDFYCFGSALIANTNHVWDFHTIQ